MQQIFQRIVAFSEQISFSRNIVKVSFAGNSPFRVLCHSSNSIITISHIVHHCLPDTVKIGFQAKILRSVPFTTFTVWRMVCYCEDKHSVIYPHLGFSDTSQSSTLKLTSSRILHLCVPKTVEMVFQSNFVIYAIYHLSNAKFTI